MDEINAYDKKTNEQEKNLMETGGVATQISKIKDYKKTSLLKVVNIFEEFLRNLERAERAQRNESKFSNR